MRRSVCVFSSYRVCFFGSDAFAAASLRKIAGLPKAVVSSLQVVSPADKPKNRGFQISPTVLALEAESLGLPIHKLDKETDFTMQGWQLPISVACDVGVVVSFGYKLPQRILSAFPLGVLNVHPSLLPHYRGAAPIQHAILNRDTHTGVSIISLTSRMDGGPILSQVRCEIEPLDTYVSLKARLEEMGAHTLCHVLQNLSNYQANKEVQQTTNARWGGKLSKDMGLVSCSQQTAEEVTTRWRGLYGFLPIYTYVDKKKLILREIDLSNCDATPTQYAQPGTMWYDKANRLVRITCSCGGSITVLQLQFENKKIQEAELFGNGYLNRTPLIVA
eukprot:gb/GEZN01008069.1/.p1 GENE.gb/GEZN01008069.1/~~gb/GEZN01008069.1/.p1  ORF type:complete len:332 (-),score=50.19 gb/GEZN01008069.1/:224-1219(-)